MSCFSLMAVTYFQHTIYSHSQIIYQWYFCSFCLKNDFGVENVLIYDTSQIFLGDKVSPPVVGFTVWEYFTKALGVKLCHKPLFYSWQVWVDFHRATTEQEAKLLTTTGVWIDIQLLNKLVPWKPTVSSKKNIYEILFAEVSKPDDSRHVLQNPAEVFRQVIL